MPLLIRTILPEDAEDVSALSRQLGYSFNSEETREQIRQVMDSSNDFAAVALMDEKLVGWVHVFRAIRLETKPFAEIGGLVVEEQWRGRGIGRALVRATKQWSASQGINELRVRCNVKRKEAHAFYAGIGFTELKEQKVFQFSL